MRSLLFVSFFYFTFAIGTEEFREANDFYEEGMRGSSLLDRQKAFNQALRLYLNLEERHASAELYKAIANTFYQLEQYPESILYNYRALEMNPSDSIAQEHLQQGQYQLTLPQGVQRPIIQKILSFNDRLGLRQRTERFFWAFILACGFISLAIWFSYPFFRILSFISSIVIFLLLLNLVLSIYAVPVEAILITPTGFYREPSLDHSQIQSQPLEAGIKVTILDYQDEWLKIKNADGVVGYVPLSTIKSI